MGARSPADTKAQALRIREAWSNINPNQACGDMTLDDFKASIADFQEIETKIASTLDQLTSLRNAYHQRRGALWDRVKRARAWAKAVYGDDSDEYERFGGTRLSERKTRRARSPEEAD